MPVHADHVRLDFAAVPCWQPVIWRVKHLTFLRERPGSPEWFFRALCGVGYEAGQDRAPADGQFFECSGCKAEYVELLERAGMGLIAGKLPLDASLRAPGGSAGRAVGPPTPSGVRLPFPLYLASRTVWG